MRQDSEIDSEPEYQSNIISWSSEVICLYFTNLSFVPHHVAIGQGPARRSWKDRQESVLKLFFTLVPREHRREVLSRLKC